MKKSIFLFFAAILCATSAWAHNLAANQYVYFEKPSDWEAAQLLIGKSGWSEGYTMTKISNTNLYYLLTIKWDGYTEYYFFEKKDKWGGEGNSPTNRIPWAGKTSSKFTSAIAKCHLFNSTKSIESSTTATAYATVVNRTQTIKVQLKDGSNWVDATVVPADLKASTYALTSETAAGAKSASLAKESTTVSATVDAAYSATVSLSCTNILDGYMFEGWYDANGNKITSYTVSDAHTVYARFIQSAEETNEVNVTYMCGATSVANAVAEFVGVETEKSFTAPTVSGYKFTNWTIGAGIDLKAGTASDATITVVTKSAASDYTLVANYEEVMETVYFINTRKWARVNIHKWQGKAAASSWPGEKLTASGEKIGEYDVYSYTAKQGDYANIIFNSKTSGTDSGNEQTADLVWTAGKYYIYNYGGKSDWYTKEDAEALLVTPVVTHDIVVKAVAPAAWTSTTIGIHYWGEGISGTSTPVATEKDGNWNKYTIKNVPEGVSVNVIFLNGTSWTDDKSKQTADITGITEDKCFQISATKLDGEGKCTVKEVDCDATIEPEVDVYTVVGSSDELGLAWDPTKEANDMEKQGDGSYKKVYSNVELTTSVEWKIAKNDAWWNETPLENKGTSGNSVLTISKSGIYNVTFTLSADLKTAHAEAELLEETNTVADCFVSGNAALTGGAGWVGNEFKMEYDEATKTYSYTLIGLVTDEAYELKIVLGGAWYSYANLASIPTGVTEGNDHSIAFKMAAAGDVVVTYNVEAGITLSGNFAEPVTYDYYLTGTLVGGWSAKQQGIEKDGELYKATFNNLADGTYEFKITDGQFNTEEDKTHEHTALGATYEEVSYNEGNIKIVTEEVINLTVIFNAATDKITFEGLTETAPAETKYYIAGTQNLTGFNWQVDGLEIKKEGDVYKHTFSGMSADTYEFKITDGTWEHQWNYSNLAANYVGVEQGKDGEGNPNGNIKIVTKEVKNIIVIFDPANNTITLEGWEEAAPTTISYVLMGVNGDWTTGIPMTVNPDNADEYVLTDQVIIKATDSIKVVTLTDGQATAWCGKVDSWSNATYTGGGEDNIVLEDGIYTFYFKKNNNEIYINQTGYARNVTNKYGTICLPYAAASTTGAIFYRVAGKETGKVYLESVDALEAGVPYIFEKTASQIKVVYTGEKETTAGSANGLVGTFADNTTVPDDAYILYGGAFCTNNDPTKPNKINAYRAYLDLDEVQGGVPTQMPGRRYIGMSVQGENETTGLDNNQLPITNIQKAIENGQLIIIRDGVKYNVQGQKL